MSLSKQVGQWFTVPERAPRAAFASVPDELRDLVRLATAAHRAGYPDIIWTSWCPGARDTPGHGTTLVMCSVKGAATILARLPPSPHEMQRLLQEEIREEFGLRPALRMEMNHFDLQLREHLQMQGDDNLRGCYVHPPVGLYAVHPSACDPRFGGPAGRPADWSAAWVAPGTRRREDPKHRERWICRFSKGAEKWVTAVDLDQDDDTLDWKSFWSSDDPRPTASDAPGEPTAPGAWTQKRGKGRGAGARPPRRSPASRGASSSSAGEPTAPALRGGSAAPDPTPLTDVDTEEEEAPGKLTKRAKRELRQHRLYQGFRNWVDHPAQAHRRRVGSDTW